MGSKDVRITLIKDKVVRGGPTGGVVNGGRGYLLEERKIEEHGQLR
jgi:hypothetical protein